MNPVINVAARHMAAITIIGLSPHSCMMPVAIASAMPVFSMAVPMTTLQANIIRIFHSMAFIAWRGVQHLNTSIAMAASMALCSKGMISKLDRIIMPSIIRQETMVLEPMSDTMPAPSKNCRPCMSLEAFASEGYSSNSESPICRRMSRGLWSMRIP